MVYPVYRCSFSVRDVNCDAHDSFYIASVSSIYLYMILYSCHDDDEEERSLHQN